MVTGGPGGPAGDPTALPSVVSEGFPATSEDGARPAPGTVGGAPPSEPGAETQPPPFDLGLPAAGPQHGRPGGWLHRGRHRPQDRRRPSRRRLVFVVVAAVVVLLAAIGVMGVRLSQTPSLASVQPSIPLVRSIPGKVHKISWPVKVASAFTIPSLGISKQSGSETARPIASLTKLMTAHIVLADHPLRPGEAGPSITVSEDEVAMYLQDVASGQSILAVQAGEVLTEYQLLEGMLVHSANNFADMLAIFDAGSVSAFVTKMNAASASMGMTQTRYADASGYESTSVSTPAALLKVAARDVANPVFDQIVDESSVSLPVDGVVGSSTPFVGVDGVVGVKSGFTLRAGGCDVLALRRNVGGVPVEVLAAVVGDHVGGDPVAVAGVQALGVAREVMSRLGALDAVRGGQRVGSAAIAASSVPVVARGQATVVGWPGQRVRESFDLLARPRAGSPAGFEVGRITVRVGTETSQVAVRTSRRLQAPTFWERVL